MASKKRLAAFLVALVVPLMVSANFEVGYSGDRPIEVVCRIMPVSTGLDNDSIRIPIVLSNNMANDSIAGVQLWISISDPHLVHFVVDSTWWLQDSICRGYDGNGICTLWYYDSIEIATTYYDTVGALTQEWEFVDARVMGSSHGVIRISGMAETGGPPPLTPAFPQGIDTLIWIYAQTNGPLGDSLCDSVDILTMFSRTETHFSNTYGEKIGCDYEWVVDTFYFNCAQWVGDTCVAWFDTIYDSIYACIIDTTRVILLGDTIDLVCCDWLPGDADYNGMYNIADVVYLIDYIFAAGAPPMPVVLAGDADCNGLVNVADIVHLISYIFGGGPVPWCTCEWLLEHYP